MAYKQSPGRSPFQKTGRGIPLNFLSPLHNHEKGHEEATKLKNVTIKATDPVNDGRNQALAIGKEAKRAYDKGDMNTANKLKDQQQAIVRDVQEMEFQRKRK